MISPSEHHVEESMNKQQRSVQRSFSVCLQTMYSYYVLMPDEAHLLGPYTSSVTSWLKEKRATWDRDTFKSFGQSYLSVVLEIRYLLMRVTVKYRLHASRHEEVTPHFMVQHCHLLAQRENSGNMRYIEKFIAWQQTNELTGSDTYRETEQLTFSSSLGMRMHV